MVKPGKKESKAQRRTSYERKTKETQIEIPLLNIDGKGESTVKTRIGFLDHMLTLFAYHGFFDIELKAEGDTHVDNHHLNEDIGLALADAFRKALLESRGIVRIASAEVPMDMVSAKVLVDISNRPAFRFISKREGSEIKDSEGYSMHYAVDFLESFAKRMGMNLHIEINGGPNDVDMHHYLEAVFKAFGMAMDKATSLDPRREGEVPSSKGIL
jgi:imidazoleglycerol-phosphate dehydratase